MTISVIFFYIENTSILRKKSKRDESENRRVVGYVVKMFKTLNRDNPMFMREIKKLI